MIVSNDMMSDPRVARHAQTLAVNGSQVTVVCPLSERTRRIETTTCFEIHRVRSKLSHYAKVLVKRRNLPRNPASGKPTSEQPQTRLLARKKNFAWLRQVILNVAAILPLQLALIREARRTNAHVYCANDLDTLLIAVCAAMFGRKVVYDSHELWPDMLLEVPEFYRRMLRVAEKFLIRRVDIVITVNEYIAKVLESRYALQRSVHVVYNVPIETKGRALRRRSRRDFKIVLYQGLFMPERGLENLVKSSRYLLPDVRLVFRGYGGIENQLKSLAANNRNVRFDEPVPMRKLVEAARSADLGVVPYLPTNLCNYLASPNKLFQYIQAGLPIAASDMPFMRKIIVENDIGVLFDPRDPQNIARALNKATRTEELDRYRKNLISVAQKYSWKNEGKKLLEIYASIKQTVKAG